MALFTPTSYWGETSTPVPPAFSPTNIPNLAGWYDASDTGSYVKSGTTITGISSQGNYGDNLGVIGNTNPIAGTTQNNLNTLYFSGTTYLSNPSTDPLVSSTGTHFAVGVFYPQSVDATKDSLWSLDAYRSYAISSANTSQFYGEIDLGNGVGADGVIGPHSLVNRENSWIIVTAMFTKIGNASLSYIFLAMNGSFGTNYNTSYTTNLNQNQQLRIMANRNGNKKQTGRFGELLLVAGERGVTGDKKRYVDQAEGYLAWKWGLQGNLPSSHPYKNNPPV